jgi:hypothetical protein
MKNPEDTAKLFSELATRYKNRAGGYTRIVHAGRRFGDAASLSYIELVDNNKDLLMNRERLRAQKWINNKLRKSGQTLTPAEMLVAINARVDVQKGHEKIRDLKFKYTPIELLLRPEKPKRTGPTVKPLDDLD